jgi:hypothetical protein
MATQPPSDDERFEDRGVETPGGRGGETVSVADVSGGGDSFALHLSQYGLSSLHDTVLTVGAPSGTDEGSITTQFGNDEGMGDGVHDTQGSLERGMTGSMLDEEVGREVDASPVGIVAYGALRREEELRSSRSRDNQKQIVVVLSQISRYDDGIAGDLKKMGITVLDTPDDSMTHLVTGVLSSSVKTYCAMAVGAYFLHPSWASETIRLGRPAPIEDHEWTVELTQNQEASSTFGTERMSTSTTQKSPPVEWAKAWRKNRDEVVRNGGRCLLSDWRVIICTTPERRDPLVQVIRVGGGTILAPGDASATLIIAKSMDDVDSATKRLSTHTGSFVPIVKPKYLAEFLKKPDARPPPNNYLTT